jgi:hypothetical protein
VLFGAAAAGGANAIEGGDDQIDRFAEKNGEGAIEHIGGRHAEVQPPRRLSRALLDLREERDDIVLGGLLRAASRRTVERMLAAVPLGTCPSSSIASQAASSTRSQVSNRC